MRVLICTSFSLTKSSAGLNKMNNLIKGLKMQGLEPYICGFSEEIHYSHGKNYLIKDNKIIFKYTERKFRHSKSLSINVNSVCFYKEHLATILKNLSIDLVIIYSTFSTLLEPIIKIAKKNKVKVTAYVGELFAFSIKYLLNGVLYMQYRAYLFSFKLLDGLICASPSWEYYSKKIKKRSVLLPTFIQEQELNQRKNFDNKRSFRIVVMSNLSKRELPLILLKSISKLEDLKEDIELYIIGQKPKYSLFSPRKSLLRFSLSKIKNLHFTGYLGNEERDDLLESSDCFVLLRSPSLETKFLFPVRVGEYLAKRKPLILTDVNPFNLFFNHKKEVYFISKLNDPNELYRSILDIKYDRDLSKRISICGFEYAKKYFSIDYLGSNVATFLKGIYLIK